MLINLNRKCLVRYWSFKCSTNLWTLSRWELTKLSKPKGSRQLLPCFCLHPGTRLIKLLKISTKNLTTFMIFHGPLLWANSHCLILLSFVTEAVTLSKYLLLFITITITIIIILIIKRNSLADCTIVYGRIQSTWFESNTDYKHPSKEKHLRWKTKWRLELLGALRIVGEKPLAIDNRRSDSKLFVILRNITIFIRLYKIR